MRGRLGRGLLLAAPSVLFLLLLGGVELGVRRLWPELPPLQFLVRDPHHAHNLSDRRGESIFEADPLLFWRLQPGLEQKLWDFTVVSTNAQGLRYPEPVAADPAGARRTLCLGDSVSFGYRVPLAFPDHPDAWNRDDAPWPALVEQGLRRANPGQRIEMLPLAVPGYSSHQGRLWLEREIGRLRPELVIACFGWNDVTLRAVDDLRGMPGGSLREAMRRAALSSQAVMRLARLLQRPAALAPPESWVPRVAQADYVANHLAMLELARRHGARFLAVAPVLRDPEQLPDEARRLGQWRTALAAAMRRAGAAWLEQPELTERGWPDNAGLFGETIHPNAAGQRRLAAGVLRSLAEQPALLPGLAVPRPAAVSAPGRPASEP